MMTSTSGSKRADVFSQARPFGPVSCGMPVGLHVQTVGCCKTRLQRIYRRVNAAPDYVYWYGNIGQN